MATSSNYETAGQFSLFFSGRPRKKLFNSQWATVSFTGQIPEKELPFQQTTTSSD